jgi:CheY-like chemotaxis protein
MFAPAAGKHNMGPVTVRVLVVDDEPDIREALVDLLEDEGYEADGASEGAEALAKARALHPGLVLLDLMMPGMNGWEFRAKQREDPELAEIPVVVLSAMSTPQAIEGAAAYLTKPFEVNDLITTIRRFAHAA